MDPSELIEINSGSGLKKFKRQGAYDIYNYVVGPSSCAQLDPVGPSWALQLGPAWSWASVGPVANQVNEQTRNYRMSQSRGRAPPPCNL